MTQYYVNICLRLFHCCSLSLEGGDESKQEELARVHARTSAAAME